MRDIAAELNVTAATQYSHIKSKEEILDWICEDVYERITQALLPLIKMEIHIEEKFTEFIKIYITECLRDYDKFEIYNRCWALSERNFQKFSDGKRSLEYQLHLLVNHNLPDDKQVSCFEDDATVKIILLILRNTPHYIKDKDNPDMDCIVKEIQDRLLHGYGPR